MPAPEARRVSISALKEAHTMTQSPVRISARHGVELWRALSGNVEQFAVRLGTRRMRMVGTRAAAEALFAHHVRQATLARAH
jgi:hypothetical protein